MWLSARQAPTTAMLRCAKNVERSGVEITHGAPLQHRRRRRTRWRTRSNFSSRAAPTSSGRASRCCRVLPSVKRRMVGPFIFFDHFGPIVVPPGGDGMAVRPHPHIGLATVTYLFDGGILPSRQPGLCAGDPARRRQLDDRRQPASPTSERTEAEMRPHRLSHARHPDLGGAAQEP